MKTLILAVLYFITATLYIITGNGHPGALPFILKMLLMPWLLIIFAINLSHQKDSFRLIMAAGLIFSLAGDIFLEFPDQDIMFIPGLVSFLMAHIMYLTVFFNTKGINIILKDHFYLLIPVVLYGFLLMFYLREGLGNMLIPVFVYAVVILTMLAAALNRMLKVNRSSYIMVLAGAILFVISDSLIAINKFAHPFSSSELVIMITYVMAQFLIITGYVKQFRISFA